MSLHHLSLRPSSRRPQRGQILIMAAVTLVMVIASAGLAIDSGFGYLVKAKLNAAVDAAAIAGAKAVPQGTGEAAQRAAAIQAAQEFFAVNYPAGYLGSTATLGTPVVSFDQGKVTVDVTATAAVPVRLMRVLNFSLLNVAAAGQAVRKDLDLAFVIDTSGSMQSAGPTVKTNAKLFLSKFNADLDRVALVHFSYGAVVDTAIRPVQRGFNRTAMNNQIGTGTSSGYSFSGLTNSSEGFWNARNQLNSIAPLNRSSLRVIVFFSDGAPNTFASRFTFSTALEATACKQSTVRRPGALHSNDGSTGVVNGLWQIDAQDSRLPSECNVDSNSDGTSGRTNRLATTNPLPLYYNAHNVNDTEFPLSGVGAGTRTVNRSTSFTNVNRVARNLVEIMAAKARSEGIFVFTLGLGNNLTTGTGPDGQRGDVVLKCMANVPDAGSCYQSSQPNGLYCHAQTENELKPCFEKLASAILRLSQ